ncbi:MAG: hypothetical protein ABSE99_12215 [Terracidiphilus sp.]|jgi:hypothetical protein
MKDNWIKRNKWIFFAAPLAIAVLVAICGEVVMYLWNWLLPALFGWRLITFWQALGLLVLCRMLFGGFGAHGPDHSKSCRRSPEHWERMTPEEREKFRQEMRSRWCGTEPPANTTGDLV